MSTSKTYTKALKDHLNYSATWLPNVKLSLGDVGILSNYEFIYQTNLKNLGITFESAPAGPPANYSYISSNDVTRSLKLSGKAPIPGSMLTEADAGISFSFHKKDAVVFLATKCAVQLIADQDQLKRDIFNSYEDKAWDRNYVVISELVNAESTSIVISEGENAQYDLQAKAGLVPAFEAINVKGSFSVVNESQIGFNCIAESGMTPLFRCLGVRKTWFRTDVVTRGDLTKVEAKEAKKVPADTVDEVDYDDYADGIEP